MSSGLTQPALQPHSRVFERSPMRKLEQVLLTEIIPPVHNACVM